MDEQLIKLVIGIATTLLTAITTFYFTLRINKAKQERELLKDQTYKYFLPFKFACNEFMYRLIHIEKKIAKPDELFMKPHFNHSPIGKEKDWFHTDWYNDNPEKGKLEPGGYFITTTMYMNCIVYFGMKTFLKEYPYLKIKMKDTLKNITRTNDAQIKRCYENLASDKDKHYRIWDFFQSFWELKETKFYQMIQGVRISTVMKNGIPYGLQDSFGDYISKNGEIMNYDEFCDQFQSEVGKFKYKQLINFWTTLVDENGVVDELKLNKVRALILVLKWIENSDIKS